MNWWYQPLENVFTKLKLQLKHWVPKKKKSKCSSLDRFEILPTFGGLDTVVTPSAHLFTQFFYYN